MGKKKKVKERTYQARVHGRRMKTLKEEQKFEHFNLVNIGGSKQDWREVWASIQNLTFSLVTLWSEVWRHGTRAASGASANWSGKGGGIGLS